jgi:uridine kinase
MRVIRGKREAMTQTFKIGVAGGSASGKSTLATAIVHELSRRQPDLRAQVMSADSYFRYDAPDLPTFILSSTGEELPDWNQLDSIDYARLTADLDARCSAEGAPDVLIVEGLMILYVPELRERFDLRLFVELDADERALRRMVRNIYRKDDPITRHDPRRIAQYYLDSARKGHARYVEPTRVHADLILRGDGDFERTAAFVADVICVRLPRIE